MNFKKEYSLYVLAVLLFTLSCKQNDKIVVNANTTSFSNFPEEIDVHFEDIVEYKEGVPKSLEVVDSTLIILNFSKRVESLLYNYSLKNKELSKGYLTKGRGPGEAYSAACFGVHDKNLWVYDLRLKSIVLLDKEKALNNISHLPEVHSLKESFYRIVLLDSSRFLTNGIKDSKFKIQEFDFSGKMQNEFGTFKNIPKDIPLDALKDAYHSFFYLSPSREKLAISYLYTDLVEIYDLKTFENIATQGPIGIDIKFKVAKRQDYHYMEKNESIRKTFLGGSVTNQYIYLAYSGVSYANRKNIDYCKFIYVYDWNGNPIKKINLDQRIKGAIAVTKDNKTLYAYNPDNGFIVKAKI